MEVERVTGIEPVSQAWKAIRFPQEPQKTAIPAGTSLGTTGEQAVNRAPSYRSFTAMVMSCLSSATGAAGEQS